MNKKKKVPEVAVTSIIRHRVREGCENDYHEWSAGIAKACKAFPGYVGTKYISPACPGEEYVTIITYDSYDNYQRWQASPERMVWLHRLRDIMEGEETREFIRGFEYWLGNEAEAGPTWPPDYRMIIVAYFAIWPLVHFVSPAIAPFMPNHWLLASLLSTGVITLLMGYVSLPLFSRLARRWIIKH